MVHQTLNTEFRNLNSEFRILNSEFRIPHFEKNVVYRKLVFGDATSGSVHGVGPFDNIFFEMRNSKFGIQNSEFGIRN